MSKPVIGYWKIRGLIEPARLLLEYANVEYEQELFECGDGPKYDLSCWTDVKYNKGLDFPNLPYYKDNDITLTESWAILRYIAAKANLVPVDAVTAGRCAMLEGVIGDFRSGFIGICYNPNHDELQKTYVADKTQKIKEFDTFLKGKQFLTGNKVSYVDFAFFEMMDHHRMHFPGIFDKYANLKAYMDRFESLESISNYRKSSRFNRAPVNNKMAKWTGF